VVAEDTLKVLAFKGKDLGIVGVKLIEQVGFFLKVREEFLRLLSLYKMTGFTSYFKRKYWVNTMQQQQKMKLVK
jgi:hypothetical protein